MMDYIKSKIAGFSIYLGVLMLMVPIPIFTIFTVIILKKYNGHISDTLILLLIIVLFLFVSNFLRHIRYLIIKNNKLKYYSLLRPFGKTLDLNDYIGKIITTETGSGGSYKVVYLVDRQNRTVFKLMGLHYKNFDEINNAISLKKISFTPTVGQYFKLLFFERITIPDKKKKNEKKMNMLLKILQIIGIAGIGLFVVGSIIKMLLKLFE